MMEYGICVWKRIGGWDALNRMAMPDQ